MSLDGRFWTVFGGLCCCGVLVSENSKNVISDFIHESQLPIQHYPTIMIKNRLVIIEDLVIILPVSEHDSNHMLYFTVRIWPDRLEQTV